MGDAPWMTERIRDVMAMARGAKADPAMIEPAEAALAELHAEVSRHEFTNKDAVLSAVEKARAEFKADHASTAIQYLSAALLKITRSSP
jgi:hypothetical protein